MELMDQWLKLKSWSSYTDWLWIKETKFSIEKKSIRELGGIEVHYYYYYSNKRVMKTIKIEKKR